MPRRWLAAAVLAVLASQAAAQLGRPPTAAEARSYVFGGFLTGAAHAILADDVVLDPQLRQRLALPAGASRDETYEALIRLTEDKPLSVREASTAEIAQINVGSRAQLNYPSYIVQAGDVRLVVEYDLKANHIPYVGALALPPAQAAAPKPAAKPEPKPRPAPLASPAPPPLPVVIEAPPPAAPPPAPVVVSPKPGPEALPEPRQVVEPRIPAPRASAPVPAPPAAAAPAAAAPATAKPRLKPNGPCVVRPVMSDQDLANCGAAQR